MSDTKNAKYDISESQLTSLKEGLINRKPTRKPTLVSIVETLMNDINTARDNRVPWDDIADEFNKALNISDGQKKITGNTLSQAYVSVKKRVTESKQDKKPSYEELEKKCAELEKKCNKLQKELDYIKNNDVNK